MEPRRFKSFLLLLLFLSLAMMDVMAFNHKAKLGRDAARRRSPIRGPAVKPGPPGKEALDGKDTVAEAKSVGRKWMGREKTPTSGTEEENKDSVLHGGSREDHAEFQIGDLMVSDYVGPKTHPPVHP